MMPRARPLWILPAVALVATLARGADKVYDWNRFEPSALDETALSALNPPEKHVRN